MRLIAASLAHAPLLAALHAQAFPPAERWDEQAFRQILALPGSLAWLADEHGFVLARVAADEAEIITLAVLPLARRLGIGAGLMAQAMQHAQDLGAAAMLLEVAEHNHAARTLYAGLGFTQVGLRKSYYADGSNALVLKADLSPSPQVPGNTHLT